MNYKKKYLKYKLKYLKLKKLSGGANAGDYDFDDLFEDDSDEDMREDIYASIDDIKPLVRNIDNLSDEEISIRIDEHINKLDSYSIPKKYSDELEKVLRQIYGVEEAKDLISKLTIINENEDNNEQTSPFTRPRSPKLDRMRPTVPENEPENNPRCNNICNIM